MTSSLQHAAPTQVIQLVTDLLVVVEQHAKAIQELLEDNHQLLRRHCAMALKDHTEAPFIQLVTKVIALSKQTIESVSHRRHGLQEAFQGAQYLKEIITKDGSLEQLNIEPLLADSLTETYHRRALPHVLENVKNNTDTQHKPMVIVISLDQQETIQKDYQQEGINSALKHMAQRLRACFPSTDPIIRYTDTTFLLFTHNDVTGTRKNMERLREQLKRVPLMLQEHKPFHLQFSGGIAPLNTESPPEESIQQALSALQAAQQAGGNNLKVMAMSSTDPAEKDY